MTRAVNHMRRLGVAVAVGMGLASCAVGPNYHRPAAQVPAAYKEDVAPTAGGAAWKPGTPEDALDRGAWWSIYGDPELDRLEREVNVSNQNVKSFEAQYRQALGLLKEARAELFPTLGITVGAQRGGGGGGTTSTASTVGSGPGGRADTQFRFEPSASWTPDVWGSIRRTIESRKANVQVNEADLANARLSAQATLAADYFDLRTAESLKQILERSVAEYRRALEITQNQVKAGTASNGDLALAQASVQAAEAQLVAVEQQRGTYEHAIAVLMGHLPSDLSVPSASLAATVPLVPVSVPSTLLERNPAVAAAERQMQVESALIGVAIGAYFPQITLSALGGYAGNPISSLFNVGNRVWSIGATATDTLIDFGSRSGAVAAARATYDEYVANYRQTVLTTFQSVEDQLLALRVLQQEADLQSQAVSSAQLAADVNLAEFNAGTIPYTTVVTSLQTLLADEQNALTIRQNRLIATVNLIQALGGGWDTSQL
jgi:NodT family efflux transporter outer membrane factor (OMF) lipoprotein